MITQQHFIGRRVKLKNKPLFTLPVRPVNLTAKGCVCLCVAAHCGPWLAFPSAAVVRRVGLCHWPRFSLCGGAFEAVLWLQRGGVEVEAQLCSVSGEPAASTLLLVTLERDRVTRYRETLLQHRTRMGNDSLQAGNLKRKS